MECQKEVSWILFCSSSQRRFYKILSRIKLFTKISKFTFHFKILSTTFIFCRKTLKFVNCSKLWQLNASQEKCHMFHINFWHECSLRLGTEVPSTTDGGLGMILHFTGVCSVLLLLEDRRKLQSIFSALCSTHYRVVFITYCRSTLEYCTRLWSPCLISDVVLLGNVPERFIHLAFWKICRSSYKPNYTTKLKIFSFKSLRRLKLRLDLILFQKNGLVSPTSHCRKHFSLLSP